MHGIAHFLQITCINNVIGQLCSVHLSYKPKIFTSSNKTWNKLLSRQDEQNCKMLIKSVIYDCFLIYGDIKLLYKIKSRLSFILSWVL